MKSYLMRRNGKYTIKLVIQDKAMPQAIISLMITSTFKTFLASLVVVVDLINLKADSRIYSKTCSVEAIKMIELRDSKGSQAS